MQRHHQRCRPGGWRQQGPYAQAPVNIEETNEGFVLQVYAPALIKENISVSTRNDMLVIQLKPDQTGSGETRYTRREYRPGEIERVFELRGKVDVDNISAGYTDGILRIDLPKTAAAKRSPQDVPLR